jgi:hypothetical protein
VRGTQASRKIFTNTRKARKAICTVLAICVFAQSVIAAESLPEEIQHLNFHFIIPTEAPTHIPHRQGALRLEFRNTPFLQMKATLLRCLDAGILPSFADRSPLLYIYLPSRDMYRRYKNVLAVEAQRQFGEVYPGVELNIKFRVVRTNINVLYIYNRVKQALEELRQRFANDREAQEYIHVLENANESAFQEAAGIEVTAPVARKIKYSMASARFAMVAGARTLQTLPALSAGGAPAIAAMALIVADAATEFFTVAFTQRIQRWLASGPLRSTKSALRSQLAQVVNNSVWNFILFTVGRPTIMQAIFHASNSNVPLPTIDTVADVAGVSAGGVGFYSAFTHGYNSLRDKGWVSSAQIDIVLQLTGLLDLATAIINSNPNWYYYRIYTMGPQWLFYAIVGALGQLAPNRTDKILAVESSVLDWEDVHGEHTTDASWHILSDQDFADAIEHYRSTSGSLRCKRLLEP